MALGILLAPLLWACFSTVPLEAKENPFLKKAFYVNPANSEEFDVSIATASGKTKENLEFMQRVASAYWIDVRLKLQGTGKRSLEGMLMDASSKSPPELVVAIWYDLPNRDCDAHASNGELCCYPNDDGTCNYEKTGDCADGLEHYKTEYVDPFISILERYQDKLPIVIILEPDSLANLATNTGHPHCGNVATQTAYKKGVKYALEALVTKTPSVSVYLDAAHGGWIGWENNLEKFMTMLHDLDLPLDKIRGFATNVANYQPLGIQCPWCPDQGYRNGYCLNNKHQNKPCCDDPCKLEGQYNFGNNELNYAAGLVAAANALLNMDAHVVIDTGRNGVPDQRQLCADWCNPRGAGAGVPSTTNVANRSLVDAYFWLKTPGESDGCSQVLPNRSKCARFDSGCASVDSLGAELGEPHAPEAGHWFDYQVKQLAEMANFDHPEQRTNQSCPADSNGYVPPPPLVPASAGAAGGNASGQCTEAWTPCDYKGVNGYKCCGGCTCVGGPYFSQCTPSVPGSRCSPTTSTLPSTTTPLVTLAPQVASAKADSSASSFLPLARAADALSQHASSAARLRASPLLRPSATGAPSTAGMATPPGVGATLAGAATATAGSSMMPSNQAGVQPAGFAGSANSASAGAMKCGGAFSQCGGKVGTKSWAGPVCCEQGCECSGNGKDDEFYKQCVPANNGYQCGQSQRLSAIPLWVSKDGPLHKAKAGRWLQWVGRWTAAPAVTVLTLLIAARRRSCWLPAQARRGGQDGALYDQLN
mmetsp:Transcript_79802/g.247953  ORF Transcript_79802/g.247953 Transcript_79802/m.247953 type:complete len:762 (+) Transcript_79802:86-2371(+)